MLRAFFSTLNFGGTRARLTLWSYLLGRVFISQTPVAELSRGSFDEFPAAFQPREIRMDWWMDGRMDGWKDGWMEGWMDGWMIRERTCRVVLRRGPRRVASRPIYYDMLLCVYIYIYIYICIRICIYCLLCVCVCVYIHIYIYIWREREI